MNGSNTLKLRSLLIIAMFFLCARNGYAVEDWSVSGFASLGIARLHHADGEFWGIEDEWDSEADTILGVQVQGPLADHWLLTAQFIVPGYTYDDRYHPFETQLEWFFLSYQGAGNIRYRAGRMRLPFYFYSESLNVGFSYPWVRPPVDVYTLALSPHGTFEGVDVNLGYDLWDAELEWQIFAGNTEGSFSGFTVKAEPAIGIVTTLRWDEWTLRNNLSFFQTTIDSEPFSLVASGFEQLAQSNPTFEGIAELFSLDEKWMNYNGLALLWDKDNWSIVAETYYIVGSNEGLSSDLTGWYVSFQYQFDKFLPYLVFGGYDNELKSDIESAIQRTYADIPAGFDPALDGLREGGLVIADSLSSSQVSYTAGVRYDLYENMDIKFEYEYLYFPSGRTGEVFFEGIDNPPNHVSITSIVIDVVF